MPQTCKSCSRANPDEAVYCHHDGSILPAHQHAALSLKTSLRPFLSPLMFPSGRNCLNFDQMLRACQEEWSAAVDLLRFGHLEPFFIQQGRADLAFAARAAASQADPEQALDELLARLPSQTPLIPKLDVTPREVVLEGMRVGEDRTFTLRLVNQGARLICGTLSTDCLWLSFADRAAVSQKTVRFPQAQAVTVHVLGKHLHAAAQSVEGTLEMVSNAGELSVTVRVQVPVTPFAHGLLAGAQTPRQVVDRVQAAPAETVAWFENGAIETWYVQNGWTYPVQGPAATGIDVVRQFFAALGLPDPVPQPKILPVAIPLSPPPPSPFDQGALAGARTVQELIERTRAAPSEAAGCFENGSVAAWYARNGWSYPVHGPSAAGVDAIRQFLRAIGEPDLQIAVPFPHGSLAGARTAQELIDRTRSAAVESAVWFENGSVAAWYARNGWTYPVQGPIATGVDAVRQFFLALRLPDPFAVPAPAPSAAKVAGRSVRLQGQVGQSLRHRFETKVRLKQGQLQSAQASCNQTWLDVRDTRIDGDAASVVLVVHAVPDRPGETLDAQVSVTLNGAHRFIIPVTLAVGPPSVGG